MDETTSQKEEPKEHRKFSQEQYEMLLRCSEKADMREWNEWREANPGEEILLQGAKLVQANLKGADLRESNLQAAKLEGANLQGAKLWEANLKGAKLGGANLQGANLWEAKLQSATCDGVVVNGFTLLWDCEVDLKTHFLGVGLDSARVEPGLKQLLKYNSRRRNWELWYKEHRFLQWPVRLFWWMSDYGRSTGRIIGAFFGLAVLFAVVYYLLDVVHFPVVKYLRLGRLVFFRAIYFSIVTMTTLGFGDMHAAENFGGYLLLTLQVLLGYVLLGALVTRFAVLFQAEGPAGKFAKSERPKERIDLRLRGIVPRLAGRVAPRIRSALLRSRTARASQNGPARNKGKVKSKTEDPGG